jgi:hypothetical protein
MLKRRLVATVGTIALALGIVLAASSAQAADRASPNSNTAMTESSVGILGCQETTATLRYNDGTSQGWYCSGTYRPKNAYVEKFSAGGWSGYLIQKYKNSSLRVDFCDWAEWSYVHGWKITKIYLSQEKAPWCK